MQIGSILHLPWTSLADSKGRECISTLVRKVTVRGSRIPMRTSWFTLSAPWSPPRRRNGENDPQFQVEKVSQHIKWNFLTMKNWGCGNLGVLCHSIRKATSIKSAPSGNFVGVLKEITVISLQRKKLYVVNPPRETPGWYLGKKWEIGKKWSKDRGSWGTSLFYWDHAQRSDLVFPNAASRAHHNQVKAGATLQQHDPKRYLSSSHSITRRYLQ